LEDLSAEWGILKLFLGNTNGGRGMAVYASRRGKVLALVNKVMKLRVS